MPWPPRSEPPRPGGDEDTGEAKDRGGRVVHLHLWRHRTQARLVREPSHGWRMEAIGAACKRNLDRLDALLTRRGDGADPERPRDGG